MEKYKRLVALLVALVAACGGGGDDGGSSCSPAPSINSTPPTTVRVGDQYHYFVEFTLACIPFTCGVELVQAPPGAGIDNIRGAVFWTPTAADANRAVTFAIATSSDLCGHRATQTWIVIVSP